MMKAKSLLERNEGSDTRIGEECTPSTSKGYVDIGLLNPCEHFDHVCVEDPLSSIGGTCVEIRSEVSANLDRELMEVLDRRLTECKYRNGTVGKKCSGLRACHGLSTQVRNKIGCGSCVSSVLMCAVFAVHSFMLIANHKIYNDPLEWLWGMYWFDR
jgi:hypothetical protein